MNKLLFIVTGLSFFNIASGAQDSFCTPEIVFKESCISGEKMQCIKWFDPKTQKFQYEWEAVNASGQAFKINNPWYKKSPGFTPVTCSNSEKS